jgi:hypothetical protein
MRWFTLIVLVTGCGGRLAVETDGGSPADANGAGDDSAATPGIDFAICPPAPPAAGSACTMPPTEGCRYYLRTSATWTCRAVVCTKFGQWEDAPGGC